MTTEMYVYRNVYMTTEMYVYRNVYMTTEIENLIVRNSLVELREK